MPSYLPAADYATQDSAGPLSTGMPAGMVAFRVADLDVLPAARRGAVLAVPAVTAVTAGTMVTFCQPVVTAPAVIRGGAVLAGGWLPGFVRLGELERHLGESQDLRVFTVTPALNATPIPGVAPMADSVAGAYSYIQAVLARWNSSTGGFTNPNGPDPFTTILPGQGEANQGDSSVNPFTVQFTGSPFPTNITISNNYSFAIARVRLRGPASSQASNARVFFRLWTTQTNDTDYDVNGAYLSNPDAAGKPASPRVGSGNTTIPFFATANFSSQTDYTSGPNIQTLTIPDHQDQLWHYFGCFLNLYDAANVINGAPVQTYLNGTHHCIVAQIAYDDAPIPQGVSPLSWDQLAQRNLQVTRSDNPGPRATHRIPQTFDTRPGRAAEPPTGPNSIYPDELMIEWGDVPTGSVASLYWPQVQASDVLALAKSFYGVSPLGMSDTNTIRIPVTRGVSYIPIPAGVGENFAGLLTIDLPTGVHAGQVYDVTVKRLGTRIGKTVPPPPRLQTAAATYPPADKASEGHAPKGRSDQPITPPTVVERTAQWRYVVGTFQIRIPVTTGDQTLPAEQTTLAIMKWRLEQMSPSNRWYPVLERFIRYISDRVRWARRRLQRRSVLSDLRAAIAAAASSARAGTLRQGLRGAVRLSWRIHRLRARRLLRAAFVPESGEEYRQGGCG